ncbi:MAG: metallophosphoesterase, partial [Oscillospiraceae bacterium]|nr:metallophosphoesterase [Oscillospiraceae bacterium]
MRKRIPALFLLFVLLLAAFPMRAQAASAFVGYPSVFVTEDNYRISFLTNTNGMAWVEIGGVAYEDTTCGIMDWETKFHGITVPQSVLNAAQSYTICFQPLASRPANNPAPGTKETKTYSFNPVLPGEDPVLLCVSDQHNNNSGAVAVAKYGAFDALVFGGDYVGHISTEAIAQDFLKYSGNIAKGTKPVIYPRGNHEIRGQYTHWIDEVMPTSETGKSYYEFIMGDIYGIVLDCGGSYTDNYTDIAGTIDFEPYRVEQTRWLEKVYTKGTWKQYSKRVIISHVPFITQANFTDVFTEWTKILNKMDMSLLVSGHTHNFTFYSTTHGSVKTSPNFPAFTMTAYTKDPYVYTGAYLTLGDQNFTIKQVDSASLAVKSTHTVTNKTYGITTDPVTEFVTAKADLLAPVVSTGSASVPSVSSPFSAHPTVFIVEDNYEISFLTTGNGMGWVEVGGKKYKDSTMGVMDWESRIHKVTVPQSVLNRAKTYKICFQSMTERAAYTPVHGSTVSRTYPFTPAPAAPTYLFMSEQLNENANALKVAKYKAWDVFVCGGKYMKAANTE